MWCPVFHKHQSTNVFKYLNHLLTLYSQEYLNGRKNRNKYKQYAVGVKKFFTEKDYDDEHNDDHDDNYIYDGDILYKYASYYIFVFDLQISSYTWQCPWEICFLILIFFNFQISDSLQNIIFFPSSKSQKYMSVKFRLTVLSCDQHHGWCWKSLHIQ